MKSDHTTDATDSEPAPATHGFEAHLPPWLIRLMRQGEQTIETARLWVEQTIFWRVWERLFENEFVDRSVALAAKAFVSLFPAIIIVAAFVPDSVRMSIYSAITRRAGLSGDGLNTVKGAFASSNDVRRATGILGLLFTFFYINSFTSALQRVYTKAWRRPKSGRVSGYAMGASWLLGIVAYFTLLGGARAFLGNGPQILVFAVLAIGAVMALWWITPWFMLQRQVRLRVLLPTGILTGAGMAAYAVTASLWMPRTVSDNQHQFGFFGVALSLVTWLTGASLIIVVGACAGPVLAEDTGWIGRRVRGSETAPILAPDAAPSLPAPVFSPTLLGALGVGRGADDGDDAN